MKITALGTGSAFTLRNRQTNLLIERNGKRLLVDCGSDARHSMDDLGFSYLDVDAVYISHAHADHIGGLEWLGFSSYFDPRYRGRPKMFCQRNLLQDLWNHSLKGGMQGLEGIDATLDTFFDLFPVPSNASFSWEGIVFDLVQAVHVSAKYSIVDTFGLMFTCPDSDKRIYHTSDVQFCPETSMKAYYKEADWILHDCETTPFKSGVHAHYSDLVTLPAETKAKTTLIHYADNVMHAWAEWRDKVQADGFLGLAEAGVIWPMVGT